MRFVLIALGAMVVLLLAWGQPTLAREGCDPAYPDVCIAPDPPDLDCGDISERNFTVLPPDPHRFDGDHNGIGCERTGAS
ncbi:MAG: hypothetical protein AAF329_05740 [Cyanobacteria bacterium P01_A01_bin.17]